MRVKIPIVATTTLLLGSMLCCLPAAAAITCDGSIDAGLDSAQADMNCPSPPPTTTDPPQDEKRTGGVSVKPACVWVREPSYQPGAGQKADGDGGHWYRKFCSFGEYQTLADFEREMSTWDVMNMRQSNMMQRAGLDTRWFTTPPPAQIPTPDQVMTSLVANLPYPKPFIAVNPVATKQVVGFPTWVWLTDAKGQYVPDRYRPKAKPLIAYGYRLDWQLIPQVTLKPGDNGVPQTCDGAGIPWSAAAEGDPAACQMTYERSGLYTLTADVGWTVRWWFNGVQQDDKAGPTTTATKAVTVLEVQALTR